MTSTDPYQRLAVFGSTCFLWWQRCPHNRKYKYKHKWELNSRLEFMTSTDAYRMLWLAHCGFYTHRFLFEHLLYKWNLQKLQKCLCMTSSLSGHLKMAVRTETRNMNLKFDDGRGDLADRGEHWCSTCAHRDLRGLQSAHPTIFCGA